MATMITQTRLSVTLIQGDQKVSVHLIITIQKVTARQPTARARGTLD
jgi:hypothetical protein